MSSRTNNPADWEPTDQKTVDEIVRENRETFETVAQADTLLGNSVEELLREVDRRD